MFENMEEKAEAVHDGFLDDAANQARLLAADLASVIEAQRCSPLATMLALYMVKAIFRENIVQSEPLNGTELLAALDRLEELVAKNTVEQYRAHKSSRWSARDE